MLKITMTETLTERRWVVQGRLVGPWVSELRTTWKNSHGTDDKRTCVIDLNDVTFIDKAGERLLRAMSKKGAQVISNGVYIKHVLEQLKTTNRSSHGSVGGSREGTSIPRAEEVTPDVGPLCGVHADVRNPGVANAESGSPSLTSDSRASASLLRELTHNEKEE